MGDGQHREGALDSIHYVLPTYKQTDHETYSQCMFINVIEYLLIYICRYIYNFTYISTNMHIHVYLYTYMYISMMYMYTYVRILKYVTIYRLPNIHIFICLRKSIN